jgi:hypothetical protein
VVAIAGAGLALGGVAFRLAMIPSSGAFAAFAAGLALAVAASVGGVAVLRWGLARSAGAFTALLLGVFLGRVVLVGVFGLVVYALAPAHLATGLLSLVGFHFIFAVTEIAILARSRPAGRDRGEGARTAG